MMHPPPLATATSSDPLHNSDATPAIMRDEVAAAVQFFLRLVDNPRLSLVLGNLGKSLTKVLSNKYRGHWFIDTPHRGQAYRCIEVCDNEAGDRVLSAAAAECGLRYSDLRLPAMLCVWIDPREVTCRFGDELGSFLPIFICDDAGKKRSFVDKFDFGRLCQRTNMGPVHMRRSASQHLERSSTTRVVDGVVQPLELEVDRALPHRESSSSSSSLLTPPTTPSPPHSTPPHSPLFDYSSKINTKGSRHMATSPVQQNFSSQYYNNNKRMALQHQSFNINNNNNAGHHQQHHYSSHQHSRSPPYSSSHFSGSPTHHNNHLQQHHNGYLYNNNNSNNHQNSNNNGMYGNNSNGFSRSPPRLNGFPSSKPSSNKWSSLHYNSTNNNNILSCSNMNGSQQQHYQQQFYSQHHRMNSNSSERNQWFTHRALARA